MKHLIALLLCCLSLCCAPHASAPEPETPRPKAPELAPAPKPVRADFSRTLHAEADFNPFARNLIDTAAAKWRDVSGGHLDIRFNYDLDIEDAENTRAHVASNHSVLIGGTSDYPIAQRIDAMLGSPGRMPVAATATNDKGATAVFLIMDRIDPADFLSVMTHELGHVAGLPDLPTTGSVMSGAHVRGTPAVESFTREDIALCRAAHYCE